MLEQIGLQQDHLGTLGRHLCQGVELGAHEAMNTIIWLAKWLRRPPQERQTGGLIVEIFSRVESVTL